MKKILLAATVLAVITGLTSCDKHNVQPAGYAYYFYDDFNTDTQGWSVDDNVNNAHLSISGGELLMNYFPSVNGDLFARSTTTGANLTGNFDIQTRIATDNFMALAFGRSTSDYGYTFFINSLGQFALYDEGDATHPYQTLVSLQASNAVVTNGGWNTLELEQYNGNWNGYINSTKVFTIAAHPLYGDQIGFEELANTHGTADYLQVQW